MPPADADVLLLGQGLAGSTLAWRLIERGLSVAVIDRGGVDEVGNPSASRVAAGLITPVTGKRLTIAGDYETLWNCARDFYRGVESRGVGPLLHEGPAIRLFVSRGEQAEFCRRCVDARFARHARASEPHELPPALAAPWGGFVMPGAARLDIKGYLASTLAMLESEGRCYRGAINIERDVAVAPQSVALPRVGLAARRLVTCTGHAAAGAPFGAAPPLAPVKGEILTIESPSLRLDHVTHAGLWIAPLGGNTYRVGSTTDRERLDSAPTEAARTELLAKLAALGVRDARVVAHEAAVRPATPDRRPTFGFSRTHPAVGWLNGLGAKGSLGAPFYAGEMADLVVRSLLEGPGG